jgi:glucose/arabinose dehydrogenase
MMKRRWIIAAAVLAGVGVSVIIFLFVRPFILRPPSTPSKYRLVEVAAGLDKPVYVTDAGDGSGRLFVLEQDGRIRIIQNGQLLEQPFLDVSDLVSRDDTERGLLGLAFHPQYTASGFFFIDYTNKDGNTVVAKYRVSASDMNRADPQQVSMIITVQQPFPNHNAGQLAFGPDGDLYIGLGDGGSAGDPNGNAQNPKALLGKLLRLDVDHGVPYRVPDDNPFVKDPAFAPEIWAMGLRNPWRFSFDSATDDLYIGDVGQGQWEEVDFQPASSKGGENYGWNAFEGNHPYSDTTPAPQQAVEPVAEYSHTDGCSITGGYVYRGAALPDLQGYYVFGDYCSGTIWNTKRDAQGNWQTSVMMNSGRVISSFGKDEDNELYLVDYGGSILQFASAS